MSDYTVRMSQRLGLAAVIAPQTLTTAASTASCGAVDLAVARRAMFVLCAGATTGTAGTIAIEIKQSSTTIGSDFAAFSTAITASVANANLQVEIEVAAANLPAAARYVSATITGTLATTSTMLASVIGLTSVGRWLPMSNATTVGTPVSG